MSQCSSERNHPQKKCTTVYPNHYFMRDLVSTGRKYFQQTISGFFFCLFSCHCFLDCYVEIINLYFLRLARNLNFEAAFVSFEKILKDVVESPINGKLHWTKYIWRV